MMTVVVARTDAEAEGRLREYRKYASHEGALTLLAGWSGIDFSSCDPDEPVKFIKNDAIQATLSRATRSDPTRVWTVGQAAEHLAIGGASPVIVGSPTTVADELQSWIEDTGLDGFNLTYTVTPESTTDFVDLVVPELQKRGAYKTEYTPGTLRDKLFGSGPRLRPPHHGTSFRPWLQS
jgi:alkanesulfonate monooxygenase SsuD/methylene tetrahydromethanopterin reductase-like flavin-dependent oxidoreductase (luciferase family)